MKQMFGIADPTMIGPTTTLLRILKIVVATGPLTHISITVNHNNEGGGVHDRQAFTVGPMHHPSDWWFVSWVVL